jgi:uncharacterized protein (TIGR02001 family)
MKMKNVVIGLLLVMCVIGSAFAEGGDLTTDEAASDWISFDLTADFNSKYVWRGQNLVDDWVLQPGFSATMYGFTLGVWGNVDMTDENGEEWEFTEVDYSVDYSADLVEGVSYSLGYIYYAFPQGSNDTYEFYGGLGFDTILSPSVTWYYDADEADGSYVAFGLGHSIEEIVKLSEDLPVGMDIGLNIGWADSDYNEYYWGVSDDGFNDLTVSVGFPIEISGWSFTPSVSYVKLLDSDIRKSDAYDSKSDYVYAGIGLSTSF